MGFACSGLTTRAELAHRARVHAVSFDSQASTFTIRTRAEGMLARFAHDLEISADTVEAEVERDGEAWRATLHIPVRQLRVVGTVNNGRVDTSVLSAKDQRDITQRLHNEILPGEHVVVRASGDSTERADVEVTVPRGAQRMCIPLRCDTRADGALEVLGRVTLSLRALSIREIKAPLGAFKVSDAVEVAFVVVLPSA